MTTNQVNENEYTIDGWEDETLDLKKKLSAAIFM